MPHTPLRLLLPLLLLISCSKPPKPPAAFTIEPQPTPPAAATVPEVSALQAEMALLAAAMRVAVDGIGTSDLSGVEPALMAVHAAREATEAALRDGTLAAPRAADPHLPPEHFAELDHQFHELLVELLTASRRQDTPAAIDALGRVLHGCETCHQLYRPTATPSASTDEPAHDH
jgi:DNA-binding GntR family transcriptional regulator